jgi:hypothetical protein
MDTHTRVAAAKHRELEARKIADAAAADYRKTVRDAVAEWRAGGASLRACAERMNITEGALRDLLRPDGTPRRAKRRKPVTP